MLVKVLAGPGPKTCRTMNLRRQIEAIRETARQLALDADGVWHAESGIRGSTLTRPVDASHAIASRPDEVVGPLDSHSLSDLSERYEFRRPLLERGLRAFMMRLVCGDRNPGHVVAEPWRTLGFSFSAAAAGCLAPTAEQEEGLEGTGHSFIYGDRNAMMRLARHVALPAVKYLSNVSAHGWTRTDSYGDPLEALADWVYIIYEVGLETGDPGLRRYYRFLVPFRAGECSGITEDTLLTFDGGGAITESAFSRPMLWELLWTAATRRELAFSKLGTDLVLASRTALDHLLDMDVALASSSAFGARLATSPMVLAASDYAFEHAGDFWHLTFAGATTHIRDGVGPRYIALLLANPGKELFCPDIIAMANGNPIVKISHSRDLVADGTAMKEYEQRIRELEEELDEAKEFNDWGRQEKLERKLEDLKQEVLRLRGLCGKTRTFSGTFDNARTSVTNAINRTLRSDAVKKRLPEAYRHLDKAISRGTFMSYDPEKPIAWALSAGKSAALQAM